MSFKVVRSIQLDGTFLWNVMAPDQMPVCQCMSLAWAGTIAGALNRETAIDKATLTISNAALAIQDGLRALEELRRGV